MTSRGFAAIEVPFTYIEQQIITSIDPAGAVDESSLHSAINLYDPLLYPNVEKGTMDPRPHVAESWTMIPACGLFARCWRSRSWGSRRRSRTTSACRL